MSKSQSNTKVSARKSATDREAQKKRAESAAARPAAAPAEERTAETKQARIIRMLQRDDGASVAELATAMGWLPHTTRAALTRLRQSGHELAKEKRETGETAYRVASPAARQTRSRKVA